MRFLRLNGDLRTLYGGLCGFFGSLGGLICDPNPPLHIFGLFRADFLHRFNGLLKASSLDKKGYGLNDQNQQRHKADYERRSIIPALIVSFPCIILGFLLSLFGLDRFDDKRKLQSAALVGGGWFLIFGGTGLLLREIFKGMPTGLF